MKHLHLLVVPLESRGLTACGHREQRLRLGKEITKEDCDPKVETTKEKKH